MARNTNTVSASDAGRNFIEDKIKDFKGSLESFRNKYGIAHGTLSKLRTGKRISRNKAIEIFSSLGATDYEQYIEKPGNTTALEPLKFGIPNGLRNHFFTGRDDILSELHTRLTESSAVAITQVQSINGLGGIGKTQTAIEYAFRHYYDEPCYEYVFWVNADDLTFQSSFAEIADQLALPVPEDAQDQQIKAVNRWLATHSGWLLIFDNVENPELLQDYIPSNPSGKVLITSRLSVLDMLNVVDPLVLDEFSLDVAIEFLFKRTRHERNEETEAAAEALAKELGGFPLALEQAGAYLYNNKAVGFGAYLRRYREKGLNELNQRLAATGKYPESVIKTWDINFEVIQEKHDISARFLEFSSFVAPDNIPHNLYLVIIHSIFTEYCGYKKDIDEFIDEQNGAEGLLVLSEELLEPLRRYSLIKALPEKFSYSIHRLVQAVLRDRISLENTAIWLKIISHDLLSVSVVSDEFQWNQNRILFPHIVELLNHSYAANFIHENISKLIKNAGDGFTDKGDFKQAEGSYLAAIKFTKDNFQDDIKTIALRTFSLGNFYLNIRQYQKAEVALKEYLKLWLQLEDDSVRMLAATSLKLAQIYWILKKEDEFKIAIQTVKDILATLNKKPDESSAELTAELGGKLINSGYIVEGLEHLKYSVDIRKKILGVNSLSVADTYQNLGIAYQKNNNFGQAAIALRKALQIKRKILPSLDPSLAQSMEILAEIYLLQDKHLEALALVEEASGLFKNIYGDNHPKVGNCQISQAQILTANKQFVKAEPLFLEGVKIIRNFYGENQPEMAKALQTLSNFYGVEKRYDEAIRYYKQAINAISTTSGDESLHMAIALSGFSRVYHAADLQHEAINELHRAFQIYRKHNGNNDPNVIECLRRLIKYYRQIDDWVNVHAVLKYLLAVYREKFQKPTSEIVEMLVSLAGVSTRLKEFDEAEKLYMEALQTLQQVGFIVPLYGYIMLGVISVEYARGKIEEADAHAADFLEDCSKRFGPRHGFVKEMKRSLADIKKQYSVGSHS